MNHVALGGSPLTRRTMARIRGERRTPLSRWRVGSRLVSESVATDSTGWHTRERKGPWRKILDTEPRRNTEYVPGREKEKMRDNFSLHWEHEEK